MSPPAVHLFDALAFVEDLPLRRLAEVFPEARPKVHALHVAVPEGGEAFVYPFGAVVFHDLPRDRREALLARLRVAWPELVTDVVREDFRVVETPGSPIEMREGALAVDELTGDRAAVVALTVAQSAAMETYERLIAELGERARALVGEFERRGTMRLRVRPLHRFIAEAINTRHEVQSVLHLLDRPDAIWSDPGMDRIYADLRGEFDLADRYQALAIKLAAVQETLELVLDVARDRRSVLLEAAIVGLIVLELALAAARILP